MVSASFSCFLWVKLFLSGGKELSVVEVQGCILGTCTGRTGISLREGRCRYVLFLGDRSRSCGGPSAHLPGAWRYRTPLQGRKERADGYCGRSRGHSPLAMSPSLVPHPPEYCGSGRNRSDTHSGT